MLLKKAVPTGILIVLAVTGLRNWLDKPYCTIEMLEPYTQKTKKNILIYAITKITSQRRELEGNDPYQMYINIDDPDGLLSVKLTLDGKALPLKFQSENRSLQEEVPGNTEFGMHHYVVTVTDRKGNTAKAESIIKVTASGGFSPVL